MLAPLAFDLSVMLIACTFVLLVSWVHDTVSNRIEPDRSRRSDAEFPADLRRGRPGARVPAPRLCNRRFVHLGHDSGVAWQIDRARFF